LCDNRTSGLPQRGDNLFRLVALSRHSGPLEGKKP
jgi:hypothetical protein